MISKGKTLKLIKQKVDAKTSRQIKLKKPLPCVLEEGIGFKQKVVHRITKMIKNGNSVYVVDDTYQQFNMNVLDTKDLHKIMWQVISDKEKAEIALEHLISTKTYLED